jgi:hypothetical protein
MLCGAVGGALLLMISLPPLLAAASLAILVTLAHASTAPREPSRVPGWMASLVTGRDAASDHATLLIDQPERCPDALRTRNAVWLGMQLCPTACPTASDLPVTKPNSAGIIIRASGSDPHLEFGPSQCQLGARTPTRSGETGDSRRRGEGADVADMQG